MNLLALSAVAAEKAAEQATDTALVEGAILLGVATLLVLFFRRLGLGAVLGYLIAPHCPYGYLVGGGTTVFAEIGIVSAVSVGSNRTRRLWNMRRAPFGLGLRPGRDHRLIFRPDIPDTGFQLAGGAGAPCRWHCRHGADFARPQKALADQPPFSLVWL